MATAVHKLQGAGGVGGADSYWIALLGGTGSDVGYSVAIDSSGNIIVTGSTASDGAGGSDLLVAKYDSSGTLLWDKTLGGTGTDNGQGVAIDSSDNIIVTGRNPLVTTAYDVVTVKYDPSGTLLWTKIFDTPSRAYGYGVGIDSLDNIVVCGFSDSTQGEAILIKYNSSGTLQWQKGLKGASGDTYFGVMSIDSSDNIIVTGSTGSDGAGGNDLLVAKLHPDGLGDGTYGNSVYQDAVLTDAAAVLTDSTTSYTDTTRSLTDAAAVLTDAAAVLTEELLPITI